jgi:hypothetical protein
MDSLRRKWMMEEGGAGAFDGGPSPHSALPSPLIPQITNGGSSADSKPTVPKVLNEDAAKAGEKPDLAIGLGD